MKTRRLFKDMDEIMKAIPSNDEILKNRESKLNADVTNIIRENMIQIGKELSVNNRFKFRLEKDLHHILNNNFTYCLNYQEEKINVILLQYKKDFTVTLKRENPNYYDYDEEESCYIECTINLKEEKLNKKKKRKFESSDSDDIVDK